MKKDIIFDIRDVSKVYCMKGVETHALRGVNLIVKRGEYAAIIGPSGSGKSTLMHIMGCLDTPTSGKVIIEGSDTSEMDDNELARIRREKIGFVFQAYNLIPGLTAIENVALPMRFNGIGRGDAQRRAKELLMKVGLGDRMEHKPSELSGGEQQRVA
ncbi:MAG: ABC transporter ATP-binding protein, partial [Candidatus Aenigmarchaeota archaeon]|nr:ABC transporter ATP-binding protein [Candidatus Aenigmarchaeota archaeon]